jgi:hypothetical protein
MIYLSWVDTTVGLVGVRLNKMPYPFPMTIWNIFSEAVSGKKK